VAVDLKVEGHCAPPPEVKVALYRIAQETLNNMAKHAQANQAWVNLCCQPEGVVLQIRDDGCGFDPDCIPPNHLGLGIMQERAKAVGATLSIESQPGHGAQIRVTWSVEHGLVT
jgi:signal transduction histidine kinase